MKQELTEWALYNRQLLVEHDLCGTGTTAAMLAAALGRPVERFESGPVGGDMQLGARIVDGQVDLLIFFWDPLEAQPHDPDIRALLRISVVWNIPVACNRATADFLVSSPLLSASYERRTPRYGTTGGALAGRARGGVVEEEELAAS